MPSDSQSPLIEWDSTYNIVRVGRARYPLPLKCAIPLLAGYEFWLPIRRSTLAERSFVRPVWKPRNGPDHMLVRVVRVDGEELDLCKIQPPIKPRVVSHAGKASRNDPTTKT